jgi:ABC-2 type transport system ATP-binding protein
MRLLLGLDHPQTGTATIAGRRYRDLVEPLTVVGALLEARAVHTGRTAYNHLLVLAQTQGIARTRVGEVIDLLGLHDVAGKRTGGFSLGMGQRLGLAAALLGDPQILVLDEPVNGLDPEGILWMRNLLKYLAAQGRTVFVSSHLMSEMALTADHLLVIGRGRLIADCATQEFIDGYSELTVLVRSPDQATLREVLIAAGGQVIDGTNGAVTVRGLPAPRIGELAARDGLVLHELAPQRASLEDAFMELTRDSLDYGTPGPAAAADPPPSGRGAR